MRRSVVFCENTFTSELPLRVLTVCSTGYRHQRPPRRSSGQQGDVPIDDVRAQQLGLELFSPIIRIVPTACNRPRDTTADFVELALSTPAAWSVEQLAATSSTIERLCLGEVGAQTNTQASNMRLHQ
jgi:hypothetical protein